MTNIDTLIQFITLIPTQYSYVVALVPVIITGLFYLLGKIRVSNYWQYHLDNKYLPILHGIVVFNNYIFLPLFYLLIILNFGQIFTKSGLYLILFIAVFELIQRSSTYILGWIHRNDKVKQNNHFDFFSNISDMLANWKSLTLIFLMKRIFPLILFFFSYLLLKNTEHIIFIFLSMFIIFMSLIYFATHDAILESQKVASLIFNDKTKLENVRIIEFLNEGQLLKFMNKDGEVKVKRTEDIKEISLS